MGNCALIITTTPLTLLLCIVIISLTFVPHAVLWGVQAGKLCPGAFAARQFLYFAFIIYSSFFVYAAISCGKLGDLYQGL